MKYILALLAIVGLSSFADQEQSTLPAIEFKKLNGSNFNSTKISNDGKPILILVWEISCKPCIQEFDNITKLFKEWQDESGVKIVAISVDDNRNYNKVGQLVRSKGWPFEFYQDKTQEIKRAIGIQYCPFSLLLNGKGEIVWRKGGYSPGDEFIMYEEIQKLSANKK